MRATAAPLRPPQRRLRPPPDRTAAACRYEVRPRGARVFSSRYVAVTDHDSNETSLGLVGLMNEAPVLELRVQECRAPSVTHLEPLAWRELVEGLQRSDHGLGRLEPAHVENDQVRIEPDAPVIRGEFFRPVCEAAPAQDAIEGNRLEGSAQDEHLARPERVDR